MMNNFFFSRGSSPRLWGTRATSPTLTTPNRFIPTPVGNTLHKLGYKYKPTVHPHACGEHHIYEAHWISENGSSPRLWGTPMGAGGLVTKGRFIPTPVGNTDGSNFGRLVFLVHPHACGEHDSFVFWNSCANGSSPRLWGTHNPAGYQLGEARFIPTPVGNTELG